MFEQITKIIKEEFDIYHQSRAHPDHIHLVEYAALERAILKRLEEEVQKP